MLPTPSQQFSIRTDTATLAVFDQECLQHRLNDEADWWSVPSFEVAEINKANVLFVSIECDGDYLVNLYQQSPPENIRPVATQAIISCPSGSLFIVAGEEVPGGGCQPSTKYGGLKLDLPIGGYFVTVAHLVEHCLDVFVTPTSQPLQNNFTDSPAVPWPQNDS